MFIPVFWISNVATVLQLITNNLLFVTYYLKIYIVQYIKVQCSVADPGSGIRCLFDPWIWDPGWVKIRIQIRDEQPGSCFPELRNHCCRLKYLNSLMQIRDPGWKKFGSGIEKTRIRDKPLGSGIRDKHLGSGIRDKHPGSATLVRRYSTVYVTLKRHKIFRNL